MNGHDLPLHGFSSLARCLTKLDHVGTVPTVLATPTASRLSRYLAVAGCRATLDLLPPSWFRDVVERLDCRASGMGSVHASRQGQRKTDAPILVYSHNRDEFSTSPPLTRLLQASLDTIQVTRLRTLDWLVADCQDCAVAIVGSGALAKPLLSGGRQLLDRHRPVVIVDLADLVPSPANAPANAAAALARELMGLLPSYQVVTSDLATATGPGEAPPRFLIAAPSGHMLHGSKTIVDGTNSANLCADGPIEASTIECLSASDVFATNSATYEPRIKRVRWHGPPSGLSVLIDCDAKAAHAQIIAYARFPNGLRTAVDGAVVAVSAPESRREIPAKPASRQPVRHVLDVPLPPAGTSPRLRHILLTPIRVSTTERPPPIEIESILVS